MLLSFRGIASSRPSPFPAPTPLCGSTRPRNLISTACCLPPGRSPLLAMSDENLDDDTGGPWFPEKKLQWRLDVVTLLAVIGEKSMEEHSQAITSSAL
ncbi:hypothetical protein IMZ48_34730 [Candidatus Bathyarchaeota archaeon]|nr:hypothetical protein [Candidatus Bathyarchaeota archaeon]